MKYKRTNDNSKAPGESPVTVSPCHRVTLSSWFSWTRPESLRQRGILGINARNCQYVAPHNPRAHYPRVDDKLLTKEICHARQIPVPETYAIIRRQGDIRRLAALVGDRQQFVVKPAGGSEGRGIIVVAQCDGSQFVTAGGETLTRFDMHYHISAILAGLYSLGGQVDCAILEQRIIRHPVFEPIAVGGTPDVRIILYRGVPVMAMVRLPTRESRGRANLHQGAVAAGIHLNSGITLGGVCKGRTVSAHPDTGASIVGLQLPMWEGLLTASMELADGVGLGYLGVDFVLDAVVGPVVLEANARPGLAIQIANRSGLRPRLDFVDSLPLKMLEPENRRRLISRVAALA